VHILLIHQAFVAPTEAGGTRHIELARHAVARGHQVTIVASSLNYLTGQHTRRDEAEIYDGVRVHRVYAYPSLHRSFVWRIVTFVSFMLSSVIAAIRMPRVDVVMGTTPPLFQACSAWVVAVVRRRPFLLEVRDLWPEFAIGMGVLTNPVLIRVARGLERFLYRRATRLLVNSPAYVAYLERQGVPPATIEFIPNGVDPGMFDPQASPAAARAALGLGDGYIVTYAGAIGLANDLGIVLDAAARLRDRPEVTLLLVGDGKERARLEARAAAEGLTNVRFFGARPKHDMPLVLAASDACLAILQDIPEFRTTYPNKVFDYMAAARPTVLAIDGVIRTVIDDARGGVFVPPGDAGALAAAIRALAADPEEGRRMGQRARAYVEQHFDRRAQAEAFVRLVEGLR
jgi:glycosyltransferase involved in cell wall biosynthesis